MVGLVLVSHSGDLARAVATMAAELAGPDVRIAPAGGTEDGDMGTSIDLIRSAVAEAAGPDDDAVAVLMDMGSSVLTAKTLLVELEDDDGPEVRLADGPFVEGTVAAAVIASTGQDIDAVVAAAQDGWSMRKL